MIKDFHLTNLKILFYLQYNKIINHLKNNFLNNILYHKKFKKN